MIDFINLSDIETRLKNGEEVNISFKYPSDDAVISINSLIAKTLSNIDRIFILDSIITILRELIVNAVKANSKRVYFEKEHLDINNPRDYETGMSKFMTSVMKNLDSFQNDLENNKYIITIKITTTKEGISIIVNNNIILLPIEFERIMIRRKKAIEYDNFSDAYAAFYDPSEGAGLGIILIVFLLRNAGIDMSCYNIFQEDDHVNTSIYIPYNFRKNETTNIIKEKIIEEVNSLPTLPENLMELQRLCTNKDASIKDITSKIITDPSLTAEILRVTNTAGYYIGKRIDDINEAVMRIGLKTLETLLMVFGSKEILNKRYKYFKQVWDHSNKIAFYGRFIAEDYGYRSIADKVFISGLLHDIGKIVLLSTDSSIIGQISEIVKNKEIRSSTIIEEISIGISHSAIGALIAEKWNFPDYIIEAIKNHHSPLNSGKKFMDICKIVYLANMISGIIEKKYNYLFIESEILYDFNLNDRDKIDKYIEKLKLTYSNHTKS